jgi:hypothetical protein
VEASSGVVSKILMFIFFHENYTPRPVEGGAFLSQTHQIRKDHQPKTEMFKLVNFVLFMYFLF